jgi:hypothetical protein
LAEIFGKSIDHAPGLFERSLGNFEQLNGLLNEAGFYAQPRESYKEWVEQYLEEGEKIRQDEWALRMAGGNNPSVRIFFKSEPF